MKSMAQGLVYGLLVLCSSLLVLLAQECPSSFPCGDFGNLTFPLTNTTNPECGLYVRGCGDAGAAVEVRLETVNQTWIEIKHIEANTAGQISLSVRDRQLENFISKLFSEAEDCSITGYKTLSVPPASPIMSFEIEFAYNITLCECSIDLFVSPPQNFYSRGYCYYYDENRNSTNMYTLYYGVLIGDALPSAFNACTISQIPGKSANVSELGKSYAPEFTLKVNMTEDCNNCYYLRGGQCRVDPNGKFRCLTIDHEGSADMRRKFVIVFMVATAATVVVGAMLMVLIYYFRRKSTRASIFFWKGKNPTYQSIEAFLKRHESLLTKRYTYFEIREMTNSFKNKLGQGGYGSVYKGKLPDGRHVAVKVLSELKGNGEEFINEVASSSQTSHVNVVSLFGFCFEGSRRALVYEFMPNGSLEKFIDEDNVAMVGRQLDCKTLHDIAIGIARGLEYLHRGCNTRIVHFDIKPHNILLDEDFCPKISDFGLAKICPKKESIVSMLVARGTIGYIAPEVFSRNFGGVSHKSDVYSFGMMVLEMVGGRKNINVKVEDSSEIYFPHWIYKCIELNQELALRCIKNENDDEMVRKMVVVSLWCIQTDPSTRPAMSKVVDMLEGSLDSLQIPPKPFLSSPKTSPIHYSTSSM